jgi:hypothetical protein
VRLQAHCIQGRKREERSMNMGSVMKNDTSAQVRLQAHCIQVRKREERSMNMGSVMKNDTSAQVRLQAYRLGSARSGA